ncbi:hypothetical protein AWZ69_13960 [Shigella sonnei]|nr:hypothetical protein AWZ69_13960 [Shigella sonnei]
MKNNAQLLMPREKMLKFGISALTDVELLALFLRTGTRGKDVLTLAKEMLENFGSLYGHSRFVKSTASFQSWKAPRKVNLR